MPSLATLTAPPPVAQQRINNKARLERRDAPIGQIGASSRDSIASVWADRRCAPNRRALGYLTTAQA